MACECVVDVCTRVTVLSQLAPTLIVYTKNLATDPLSLSFSIYLQYTSPSISIDTRVRRILTSCVCVREYF